MFSTNPLDLPDVTIDGSIGDHPPSRAASASPGLVPSTVIYVIIVTNEALCLKMAFAVSCPG